MVGPVGVHDTVGWQEFTDQSLLCLSLDLVLELFSQFPLTIQLLVTVLQLGLEVKDAHFRACIFQKHRNRYCTCLF